MNEIIIANHKFKNVGIDGIYICKDAIFKVPFDKDGEYEKAIEVIEKRLKALEIIRRKNVDPTILRFVKYNHCLSINGKCLTQEEFDLLKEVFK